MKTIFAVITMVTAAAVNLAASWSLDLESGQVSVGYNDVQIPGNSGSRISLKNDLKADSKIFYRIRATKALGGDKYISFLYAPLTLDAAGVLAQSVNYNGENFAAASNVSGKYRFDSYRVTYYKLYNAGKKLTYKFGFTAKIRDASISLSDGIKNTEKKNTGFVPLLHFGLNYDFTDKVGLVIDADALAGGPGRAEDALVALTHKAGNNLSLRLGYRIVEGGANTNEVYNFALLNYITAGMVINF